MCLVPERYHVPDWHAVKPTYPAGSSLRILHCTPATATLYDAKTKPKCRASHYLAHTCQGLCCSFHHLVIMQLDAHILQLLTTDACWPAKQSDSYSSILAHGADALDVLAAAARSTAVSGLYVGTAYRAHTALLLLQAQISGERLQQLLSSGSGSRTTTPGSAELSPEASSTADAAGQQQFNSGAPGEGDPEDCVLEVALVSSKPVWLRSLAQSLSCLHGAPLYEANN